eukprot:COSAG01_NODE_54131_length_334_cov_0.838298_1_plen_25_part_01
MAEAAEAMMAATPPIGIGRRTVTAD